MTIGNQNRDNDAARRQARDILSGYVGHKGALLMALLDVQYQLNYIPETTVDAAAEILGYSKPEVWGVLSFYSDFTVGTTAEHIVDVCIDTPCHVAGARRIWSALEDSNADASVTIRRISCPRLCHQAPVIAIDQVWHGRMSPDAARHLVQTTVNGV